MPRGLAPANICPSGSRRAPDSRPSLQSSPLLASWPRAAQIAQHRVRVTTFDHHLAGTGDARPETARPVLGMERRRVDRFLDGHVVVHHAQEHGSATIDPAARRPACRTPSRLCRRAARNSATAWCAAACRAPASSAGPASARTSGRACPSESRGPAPPARIAASRRTAWR